MSDNEVKEMTAQQFILEYGGTTIEIPFTPPTEPPVPPEEEDLRWDDAVAFTLKSEGGFVNDKADIGGATMMGITSKYYPKEFKEIRKAHKDGGIEKAKEYAVNFYKKEFWDKTVDDKMTTEQAKVVFDTAVLFGQGRAKQFFKDSGGNVGKYLEIREQYHINKVKKDPTQQKFLKGWLNRIENLRRETGVHKTPEFPEELGVKPTRKPEKKPLDKEE